ncbi:N-lysine methyltransferase KMT5A-A [Dissostichus eleginoides]|uniref:N-lysine methyltransferase KMT5A-A n=1 Tax=Dissostichus eleginoides TaxID=100907 RepID=A0AAD9EWL1_DISEL|nr:N-lysine methyltransferase KMT5A-A [Dissostichus eleginoides]
MKNSSEAEVDAEVQKAKESTWKWTLFQRTIEYKQLLKILPHKASRVAMVKYFIERDFFILDKPCDEDMDCAGEASTSCSAPATTSAAATSAPNDDSATVATSVGACTDSSSPQGTESSDTPSSDEGTRVSSKKRRYQTTVREKMQAAGLYNKFPSDCKILLDFEKHLSTCLKVQNYQQEIDNVARFLRYIQPTGDEPNFDFLTNTTDTMNYFQALDNSTLSASTILNYFKNILRFLKFLRGNLELVIPRELIDKYSDYLVTLRVAHTRRHTQVKTGKQIAISGEEISPTEKTWYRYYCQGWFQAYHMYIRADVVQDDCNRFFVSAKGKQISSASSDLGRLHHSCGLKNTNSHEVRRAIETELSVTFSAEQKKNAAHYLAHTEEVANKDYRQLVGFKYGTRQEYMFSHFTHRKPSVTKMDRLIQKEEWVANFPKSKDVLTMWKPALKCVIESDKTILNSVSRQKWKGLAIKMFDGDKREGVVATRNFTKGDIVCDYHGPVITHAAGKKMMEDLEGKAGYLFFLKTGTASICIDAQTYPCKCHDTIETIGRKINHSSKNANIVPLHVVLRLDEKDMDVILFKATKDIKADNELKFDYGVKRKSFRGEGIELQ